MKAKWKDTETAIRFGLAWMVAAVGLNIVEAHGQQLAVDFNRDIRPVLAESCFACHGPDEQQREADLRLDLRSSAIESGALTPGSPDDSEMLRRIESQDESEQMPPPEHDPRLTVEQKQNFRRWIKEGAAYAEHWAFVPPKRSVLPEVSQPQWARNAIDLYVMSQLDAQGLQPSPEADTYTLVRRVYLDLLGRPPTPEEAERLVSNPSPDAYDTLVDHLLGSKEYGERWARVWLDLARYADTNGYEKDRVRSIWPYRDWVIRALNEDVPFDEFSIQQLAGDMLEESTAESQIATGFHRNTMLNEEGGIDPLEYRFYAMVDRVATTGTVWMGLSIGCAQCHTHKYDPISHQEYYQFMALLNNADEPDLMVKTEEVGSQQKRIEGAILELEKELPKQFPPTEEGDATEAIRRKENFEKHFQAWLIEARKRSQPWRIMVPAEWETNLPRLELLEDGSLFSTGDITKRDEFVLRFQVEEEMLPLTALRLEVLPDERLPAGGPGRAFYEGRKGDFFLSEIDARLDEKTLTFASGTESYGKISIGSGQAKAANVFDDEGSTGWSTARREGEAHHLVLNFSERLDQSGILEIAMLFERHFAASLGRFRISAVGCEGDAVATSFSTRVESLLQQPEEQWSAEDLADLRLAFCRESPELADARKVIEKLRSTRPSFPTTMVFRERPEDNPRATFLHHRGEYLSPRDAVAPGLPKFLRSGNGETPRDRLALSRWLVSTENPLVNRVVVNRAWQSFFGVGLHRTSDDFGTQTEPPRHLDLLDWLACEMVEKDWSMKSLHRFMVTSATYRQSSNIPPELQEDGANESLARGSRFRVEGEIVRDIMLSASGLLSQKMYGPGVRPPQPSTVTAVAYGSPAWKAAEGEDRFRRSLYTHAKRTAPFAAFTVFDAPTGENCVARRDRSNTPLQALTLMNDEMYLEYARALARLAWEQSSVSDQRIEVMFRRLVTRPPSAQEIGIIKDYLATQTHRLEQGELDAAQIAKQPNATGEFAAWVMVARAMMNLDEVITRP
ncbi:MAG: PSD1 and planctomycete cytochrome C domain-containing protein [Planctomycetota bacterium]|nr:PSD1 and planctomycete cytochrome C domain-containing protein [Planctomycetota bacterium]